MAYVVNDFARCYVYSGGFPFRRKAWLSWKCAAAASRCCCRCYHRLRPPPPLPPPLLLTAASHYYRRYIRDFYWPLAAAGLVLTVAILWWEGEVLHFGAWATFLTVVMYTANLWGVLMFIFLMSHALVRSRRRRSHRRRRRHRSHRSSCRSNYGICRGLIRGSNAPTTASANRRESCCPLRRVGAPNSRNGNG